MALESSNNDSCRSEKPISLVWGCELTRETPTYTFEVPEEWSYEQQLALRTICLGEKAKDEFNVVEVVPQKDSKESAPVCIANLKLSVLPMIATPGLDLTPPVTFRLKSGSGPVYLAGQHMTAVSAWNESEEEEEEESLEDEDMEESSKEESPVKPIKAPASKRSSASKKETELAAQEQSQPKAAGRGRKPAAKK
ncbi:PREDICTED: nucleoplasmin ATPase-like [Gekko japonicus]|uniref:Nucleoplasmin ATPase-like n=1 Tax=Gekko japonicus TaxID=146911 RepID=A0ABM1LFY5_GEKJA|nr:PREDICTED: nucleoplasmin ATPase-like [Gekko japonicus]